MLVSFVTKTDNFILTFSLFLSSPQYLPDANNSSSSFLLSSSILGECVSPFYTKFFHNFFHVHTTNRKCYHTCVYLYNFARLKTEPYICQTTKRVNRVTASKTDFIFKNVQIEFLAFIFVIPTSDWILLSIYAERIDREFYNNIAT